VKEALDILRGAVMIVYPMGLPPHDPIKMEFDNEEDLAGTQVGVVGLLDSGITTSDHSYRVPYARACTRTHTKTDICQLTHATYANTC